MTSLAFLIPFLLPVPVQDDCISFASPYHETDTITVCGPPTPRVTILDWFRAGLRVHTRTEVHVPPIGHCCWPDPCVHKKQPADPSLPKKPDKDSIR